MRSNTCSRMASCHAGGRTTPPGRRSLPSKEEKRLNKEEKRLKSQLRQVKSQLQKVREQKKNLALDLHMVSVLNWDELSAFAKRVEPIENALMSALESELEKKKPTLSALTDLESPQPKLSLFLNCMGTHSKAIHATRHLDSTMFQRQTKNPLEFIERYGSTSFPHTWFANTH